MAHDCDSGSGYRDTPRNQDLIEETSRRWWLFVYHSNCKFRVHESYGKQAANTVQIIGIAQMVATFVQARLSINSTVLVDTDQVVFQKVSCSSLWLATVHVLISMQAYYGAQLLFIPAICFAKLSVLYSLHKITPVKEHKWPIIAFAGLVSLLLLGFEFATAFQCSRPHWAILSGKCFNQVSWGFVRIMSCRLWICDRLHSGRLLVCWILLPMHLSSSFLFISFLPYKWEWTSNLLLLEYLSLESRKFTILRRFTYTNFLSAIAASICRVIYLSRSNGSLEKDSFAFWVYILNTEIEQGLAIITACVPFLKPFFESLETGMLAPSHGLATMVGSADGSGNRSKKSNISNGSYRLRTNPDHGINVSRRISTHSEELGLIKEETKTWVQPVPNN